MHQELYDGYLYIEKKSGKITGKWSTQVHLNIRENGVRLEW